MTRPESASHAAPPNPPSLFTPQLLTNQKGSIPEGQGIRINGEKYMHLNVSVEGEGCSRPPARPGPARPPRRKVA